MRLAELQRALQSHLFTGDAAIAGALCGGGIGIERRLAVYRTGYRLRLLATMNDSFGHCASWLGSERFDAFALAYIDAHPSDSRSLNDFGAGWPEWLAQACRDEPEVGELARLDWTLRRAFDGPDCAVIGPSDMAELTPVDWAVVGFSLVPTATLLTQRCNTIALWSALDRDEQPPPCERFEQPHAVLAWRKGHQPHFRSLDAAEQRALLGLREDGSFAALCEALQEDIGETDAIRTAGRWLRQWMDDGLLGGITRPCAKSGIQFQVVL